MSDENWRERYGLIDWKGLLMTPEQILAKCQTPEGANEVKDYILKARVAFTMQTIFQTLDIIPSVEDQQRCCLMMFEAMFRVPTDQILEYARQVGNGLENMDDEKIGGTA